MYPENNSYTLPPLTPLLHPWMERIIEQPESINHLFKQYGSPINLHHLAPFAKNYEAYQAILQQHQLKHQIFFARKANKCQAFVKKAQKIGFGIDTASYKELKQCLEVGYNSDDLVLTAAMKNKKLVRLALHNDVLIILDNEDECHRVNQLAQELDKKPQVGIRISGFTVNKEKLYSRFGFDIEGVAEFVDRCLGEGQKFPTLQFKGFHFHLDGYSYKQRGAALYQTIQQADVLQKQGITTSFIDIGGGLLTNYLTHKTEWLTFWDELKKAVRGQRPPITFGNEGLGFKMVNGTILGSPEVYPYYNDTPKDQFLAKVLSYKNGHNQTVASLMRERNIEFRMEPGRSLLDQTGMTIAKVVHRKQDQHGNWLVGLEMNRSQLFSSSADFLVDPIFISMTPSTGNEQPTPVYFTGGYCLEQDIILKRKIRLPQLPEIGDVIGFPNTAGYMMHFYETQSHLYDFSTNVIAKPNAFPEFIRDADW